MRGAACTCCVVAVLLAVPAIALGEWTHQHRHYPNTPYGESQIRQLFGRPCNRHVNDNTDLWRAADTGDMHSLHFHRKLGGETSSNLDYDVKGHLDKRRKGRFLKSGIGIYNCRAISGTNSWSTHAWGIAIDISWNYEHFGHNGHPCHVLRARTEVPRIFKRHGWKWGRSFPRRDCMHFQYATGY
jgi:D-alanyl-D-alanine carboxypeptidase